MKNIQSKYSNKLREIRRAKNMTQTDVAIKLNLSPNNQDRISKWENGEAKPSIDNLFKLCSIYQTTPQELYPELNVSM